MAIDFSSLLGNSNNIGNDFQQGIADAQAQADRQRKLVQQTQALRDQQSARTGIAAALQTGDYSKAAAQAALYGDDKSATVLAGLGNNNFDHATKNTTAVSNIVNSVYKLPYEQRRSAIQSASPFLLAQGVTKEQLDAFDPTDANIVALGHVGYDYGDQVKDGISQQNADAGTMNAQTGRITAENPVVVSAGSSLVGRDGNVRYTAPQIVNAAPGNNVMEIGGITNTGPITAEQLYMKGIEPQESGGRAGAIGPATKYGNAIGASQMLPATAAAMAAKIGVPYRDDLMRATTLEGLAYQRRLGVAYAQTALDATGGDPRAAAAYYHGGPNMAIHGPKTAAYADRVVSRLGATQAPNRPVRNIQTGTDGTVSTSVTSGDLASVPQNHRSMVQAIAEGRAAAPNPRTKEGAQLLAEVTAFDPTFDAANATTRVKTRSNYTSGKMAESRTALNTAIGHIAELDNISKNLGNSRFLPGYINPLYNTLREKAGNRDIPQFEQTKGAVASEMRKVFAGSGGGSLQELQEWQAQLDSSKSPEQLHAVLQNGIHLLGARLGALQQQYQEGMGRSDNTPAFVTPENNTLVQKKFGIQLERGSSRASGSAKQPPAGAIAQLRANPSTRGQFDAVFGAGAAAKVLGR